MIIQFCSRFLTYGYPITPCSYMLDRASMINVRCITMSASVGLIRRAAAASDPRAARSAAPDRRIGATTDRQTRDAVVRVDNQRPALIGFHCPVCGLIPPAKGRRPMLAPLCAGPTARSGRPHTPTPMRPLFVH